MKKTLAVLIALMLLSLPLVSLAAGKADVTQEKLIVTMRYSSLVFYYYAEITNIGDKPITYDSGLLELMDKEGNAIRSDNIYSMHPNILQAGEKGFVCTYGYLDQIKEEGDVDDHSFNVLSASTKESIGAYLDVTDATCAMEAYSAYSQYYALTALVQNNTSETVRHIDVVFVGRDAQGEIMFMDYTTLYDIGLLPGSTIEVKIWPDESGYWADNNCAPATIEAIAFGE